MTLKAVAEVRTPRSEFKETKGGFSFKEQRKEDVKVFQALKATRTARRATEANQKEESQRDDPPSRPASRQG